VMKCPMCAGIGEKQIGTGWPSDEGGELTEIVQCSHCDGTGEIQEKDWWLCEVLLPPDGGSEIRPMQYAWNGQWREADNSLLNTTAVRPIARMKEVK